MRFLSVAAIVIGVFSVAGFSREHVSSPQVPLFRRGDANVDGRVNLSDGLFTLRFLFQGGEAPPCSDAADADDSGRLDLKDVIYTFNFLLQGGPPPAQAFQCALDPTSDDLDCRNYAPEDPSLACDGALDLADNGGGEAVGEVQPRLNARFQSG